MAEVSTRDIVLRMEGKIDAMMCQVKEHDTDLNGNGKAGLKADVRDIKKFIADLSGIQTAAKDFGGKVKLLAVGSLFAFIGSVVLFLLKLK